MSNDKPIKKNKALQELNKLSTEQELQKEQVIIPELEAEANNLTLAPTSKGFTYTLTAMANAKYPDAYVKSRAKISGQKEELKIMQPADPSKRQLYFRHIREKATDGIDKIDLIFNKDPFEGIARSKEQTIKLFLFIINELIRNSNIREGSIPQQISFVSNNLVEAGYYSTTNSASKAIQAALPNLTGMTYSISKSATSKDKKVAVGEFNFVPIKEWEVLEDVKPKLYTVFFGDRDNRDAWDMLFGSFTCIPTYTGALGSNSILATFTIFERARQIASEDKIKEDAEEYSFTVSLQLLNERIGLGDYDNRNAKAKNLDPIIKAYSELLNKELEVYKGNPSDIDIKLIVDDRQNAKRQIENGKIKVTLRGKYLNYFKGFLKNKKIKIAKNRSKRYLNSKNKSQGKSKQ